VAVVPTVPFKTTTYCSDETEILSTLVTLLPLDPYKLLSYSLARRMRTTLAFVKSKLPLVNGRTDSENSTSTAKVLLAVLGWTINEMPVTVGAVMSYTTSKYTVCDDGLHVSIAMTTCTMPVLLNARSKVYVRPSSCFRLFWITALGLLTPTRHRKLLPQFERVTDHSVANCTTTVVDAVATYAGTYITRAGRALHDSMAAADRTAKSILVADGVPVVLINELEELNNQLTLLGSAVIREMNDWITDELTLVEYKMENWRDKLSEVVDDDEDDDDDDEVVVRARDEKGVVGMGVYVVVVEETRSPNDGIFFFDLS